MRGGRHPGHRDPRCLLGDCSAGTGGRAADHRDLTQGFTVISGHAAPGDPASTLNWQALATANTTLVIMMGVATLADITAELIKHGLPADTPAMTVADAAMPSQQAVRGTVSDIAALTKEADIKPPAITVIGAVAGFGPNASREENGPRT